jgi:hypothetical protein
LYAPADTVKEGNPKLSLKRQNLARCGWLGQIEPTGRAGETTGVSDDDEGAQMLKVQFYSFRFCIDEESIKALDTSDGRSLRSCPPQ